ncbi:exodeoxyribonuclease VII large subunit [Thermosipho ferrireducens]|uniref:Exodeoxyribonuclease 7 large subunit n=1 Tax=Thermosipho ferrireducens TaxID=2571116 RepID=A0ABX7S9R3_9BACT|nr:exodeoxyribonuclease VII large subunit [Thermosipho ferrireducens]QTA37965.1 exodeoxyribonuclease VII large subunit [Thermosipho ferrireducens]
MPKRNDIIEFNNLIELYEYVKHKIDLTGITSERMRFHADVVRAKSHKTGIYIDVSQEYVGRNGKRNIEITVYIPAYIALTVLSRIGLRRAEDLVGKKWVFQGKLSLYKDRMSFTFYADTIAPIGDSEIEKRRKEIIKILKSEGLLMESYHDLSELEPIKKIAIISSKTAAGYEDFLKNLTVQQSYKPIVHLYESPMQGAETPSGVIMALRKIKKSGINYDVVVIARGGGSTSDLMYFDDLKLGIEIALFNEFCPVLSGIGHERDYTVPDYVAWKRFATPTEVARAISKQIEDNVRILDIHARETEIFIRNLLEKFRRKSDTEIINTIRTLLHNSFQSYGKNLNESQKNLKLKIESLIKTRGQTISKEFIKYISDLLKSKVVNQYNYLRNTKMYISQTIIDKISSGDNSLTELFNDLVKKGGYATSLLFGGAVLKNKKKIIVSVKDVKKGDIISGYLKDGCLKLEVRGENDAGYKENSGTEYTGNGKVNLQRVSGTNRGN